MDNNNLTPENIEVPSLDTIQDLPEVEMPKLDEVQPSPAEPLQQVPDAQAIPQPQAMPQPQSMPQPQAMPQTQAMPQPQAIPQVPTYPQPPVYPQVPTYPQQQAYPQVQPIRQVQSVPKPSVSYAPTNQAVFVRKRSGGQIACLVIGIILAVINIFFEFVLIVGYANNALPSDVMLVMTLFFGVFLFVGILFIIGGARKGTKLVSVGLPQNNATLPVQTSYGMPYSSLIVFTHAFSPRGNLVLSSSNASNPDVIDAKAVGAEYIPYDYTIPLLIFAGFGVAALLIAIYLKALDKKRSLGLELPNIQK